MGAMSQEPSAPPVPKWPQALAVLAASVLAAVFGHLLLRLPIDYGDNFEEVSATYGAPLLDNLVREFANPKFYFRPFEIVWRYLIAFGFGEGVFGYNRFMVIEWTLIVVAFAIVCRPRNGRDLAAFLVALGALAGHQGTQAIWEGATTISNGLMLFVGVIAIGLIGRPASAAGQLAAFVLTAICLLTKELGLVVAGVFVLASLLGMPGLRRSTAIAITLVTIVYLIFHFYTLPDLALGHQNRAKTAEEYLSNVVATVVMFCIGIPFDGEWTRSAQFFHEPWQWVQIAVGLATLMLLAGAWRLSQDVSTQDVEHGPLMDRRWLVLFAAALLACGAVSFQITRHRQGAPAVPLFAYAVYLSMRVLLEYLDRHEPVSVVRSRPTTATTSVRRAPFLLAAMTASGLACAMLWPLRVVIGFEYVRALSGRMHGDFPEGIPGRWNSLDESRRRFLVPFVESVDRLPWARRDVPVLETLGEDVVYSVNR